MACTVASVFLMRCRLSLSSSSLDSSACLPLFLGAHALQAEPELAGNGDSKPDFGIGEDVSGRIIGHELADELPLRDERYEGKCRQCLRL